MIHHGLSFQQSKALGFLESVALERNLHSTRSVPTVGVGPGTVLAGLKERIDHVFGQTPDPAHIHTLVVDESVSGAVIGSAGALGNIVIPGSGWTRVFLRVKGVAAIIPEGNLTWTQGRASEIRIGAMMCLNGCHFETDLRVTVNLTDATTGSPFSNFRMNSGVVLNLVKSETGGYSDGATEFDRIVTVSCQAPRTLTLSVSWPGWLVVTGGGRSNFYTGGTSDPLVTYQGLTNAQINAIVGTPAISGSQQSNICRNEGINSTSLLPPYGPLFANPTNIVQLQVQLLGFRPDTVPRAETYSD